MATQWDKPGDTGKKDETGKGDVGKQGEIGKQGGDMPKKEDDKGFPEKKKEGDLPR